MSLFKNDAMNNTEITALYNLNNPKEMREFAYKYQIKKTNGQYLIVYDMAYHTVDEANKLYAVYQAEGSPKASEIVGHIQEAKGYIRNQYPD